MANAAIPIAVANLLNLMAVPPWLSCCLTKTALMKLTQAIPAKFLVSQRFVTDALILSRRDGCRGRKLRNRL